MRDEAGSSSLADDSAGHVRNAKAASKLDVDGAAAGATGSSGMSSGGRLLRELKLEVPIRYSAGDEVESWLHRLLCLDATDKTPALKHGCPHPSECDLYYVERDTLFSHHKAAEDFLQGMMSLYVSSHYKNSPNDLQLLSDAPVCMCWDVMCISLFFSVCMCWDVMCISLFFSVIRSMHGWMHLARVAMQSLRARAIVLVRNRSAVVARLTESSTGASAFCSAGASGCGVNGDARHYLCVASLLGGPDFQGISAVSTQPGVPAGGRPHSLDDCAAISRR